MYYYLVYLKRYLLSIPTALGGLALGIASLGICFDYVFDLKGDGQLVAVSIAAILLINLLIKYILYPRLLREDLKHNIIGSVLPTFAMGWMLVAGYIGQMAPLLAKLIWTIAILIHLLILCLFVFYRVKNFCFQDILPTWFIPPIGLVVAALTFPEQSLRPAAELFMDFGVVSYALLLPIILMRLWIGNALNENETPTLVILATPASLCLVGYLSLFDNPPLLFISVLTVIAIAMTSYTYIAFIKLLRLPFTPAYSMFTFPLVISATALFKVNAFFIEQNIPSIITNAITYLAYLELLIATTMVIYVSLRYCLHYLVTYRVVMSNEYNEYNK